jgi:hypothetical protein
VDLLALQRRIVRLDPEHRACAQGAPNSVFFSAYGADGVWDQAVCAFEIATSGMKAEGSVNVFVDGAEIGTAGTRGVAAPVRARADGSVSRV